MNEEESEVVFLFIQEDGGIIVVQNGEEETLTDEQLKILMRILACYEPSVFLWLVLTIEIYLNIIVDKLSKLWRQDR
jgi:hypothetical protein